LTRPRATYRVHFLKSWPEFFEEVVAERKRFEVRRNDRDYRARDLLVLQEWSKRTGYSGREAVRLVVAVSPLDSVGVPGFVCLELDGFVCPHDQGRRV
jgi:hypothetical protein